MATPYKRVPPHGGPATNEDNINLITQMLYSELECVRHSVKLNAEKRIERLKVLVQMNAQNVKATNDHRLNLKLDGLTDADLARYAMIAQTQGNLTRDLRCDLYDNRTEFNKELNNKLKLLKRSGDA